MNTTSLRIAKYAGTAIAGIAASVVLAAPALAEQPDPSPAGQASETTSAPISSSGGMDWSSLVTGLGGGVVLSGAIVLGATQTKRHRSPQAA